VIPQPVARELRGLLGSELRVSLVVDRGLSNAVVYKIESYRQVAALKRWPLAWDRKRLAEIHRFQKFLSRDPESFTPQLLEWSHGDTLLETDQGCWELSDWRPGKPLETIGLVSDAQLIACAQGIARLHEGCRRYGVQVHVAPGLTQRRDGLMRLLGEPHRALHRLLPIVESHRAQASSTMLLELATRAQRVAASAVDAWEGWSRTPVQCSWVLRDLWREHLLFRGEALTGILDFGAARIDWPGLDLIRALGTLMLDSDPRWSLALAQYVQRQPSIELDLGIAKWVHRVSVSLSAMQWLEWLADGTFDWQQTNGRQWQRIKELLAQLQDIERPANQGGTGG